MQNQNLTQIDIHDLFELLSQNQEEVSASIESRYQETKVDHLALVAEKSLHYRSLRIEREGQLVSNSDHEEGDS